MDKLDEISSAQHLYQENHLLFPNAVAMVVN